MGLAVISDFNELDWYPNEFFGNNPPEDRDRYINLAAECWNDAGLELMTGRVHIKSKQPDKTLYTQLTTRKKEFTDDSKIRNEKKDKMKARNLSSPDRRTPCLELYGLPSAGQPASGPGKATSPLSARVSTLSGTPGNSVPSKAVRSPF